MNQKTINTLKTISTCFVVCAVILAFLISGIRFLGFQVFGVLTGSMEPTYPVGSLIYVKPVEQSELRLNDVITFSISPSVIATHRIVELVPDENNPSITRYRTKGDANNEIDASLVSYSNIIGKVMFSVPQLGNFASYIQEPPGLYIAIAVCAVMIAFVFFTDSMEEKLKAKKKKRKGAKAAQKEEPGFMEAVGGFFGSLTGKKRSRADELRRKKQKARPVEDEDEDEDEEDEEETPRPPRRTRSTQQQDAPYQPQQAYAPRQGYPQQGYPQQGYQQPQQGYPQGYPQQGGYAPRQGYPQQGYQQPQQGYPQGYPQQGGYAPRQGYPQQGYQPQQGYPQGYQQPQQGYPQGYQPQQGYPQGYQQPQQSYPQGYPQQGGYAPRQGYPQQSYQPQQGYQQPTQHVRRSQSGAQQNNGEQ